MDQLVEEKTGGKLVTRVSKFGPICKVVQKAKEQQYGPELPEVIDENGRYHDMNRRMESQTFVSLNLHPIDTVSLERKIA